MSRRVSGDLRHIQRRNEKYFDGNIWMMTKLSLTQMFYADRPPLVTPPSDSIAENYNKLLPIVYDQARILETAEHFLTVDEYGICNTISIHRATPVVRSINHLGL